MKLNNYSDYEINIEDGTIYSYKSDTTIGHLNNDGYVCTTIYDDYGNRKSIKNHRIVWEVVNGSIPDGYEVHHVDKNRSNNSITNLELVVSSIHKHNHFSGENNPMYGKKNPQRSLLNKMNNKPVSCYTLDGEFVKSYSSAKETSIDGFIPANVTHCCKGDYSTHKGYKWVYMG